MDRDEAIQLLRGGPEGVDEWNRRRADGEVTNELRRADLAGADLSNAVLRGADLRKADLGGADLRLADLGGAHLGAADLRRARLGAADLGGAHLGWALLGWADLRGADLRKADLGNADLGKADLGGADLRNAYFGAAVLNGGRLSGANLTYADLSAADLTCADLSGAHLGETDLRRARLGGADLHGARLAFAHLGDVNLSEAIGLSEVVHESPSTIGTDTMSRSRGRIPEAFLRGCGLAPWEVLAAKLYDPELTPPQMIDLQYRIFDAWTKGQSMINGCFISYSSKDSAFAEKLRERLMKEGVNVWLDRHEMVAGPIQDQVWRAIQVHHVVVLILSDASVKSDWVENELDMARGKERDEGRAVLCPVALDDAWKVKVESKVEPRRHLWRTLGEKHVVDFAGWEADAFDAAFAKLLKGLKVHYGPGATS